MIHIYDEFKLKQHEFQKHEFKVLVMQIFFDRESFKP